MRHIILTFLCATLSLMCMAQAERAVNGVVLDEKGLPVEGAVIQPVGTDWKFNAKADGTFMILVPHYVKELSVGLPGFLSQTLEIDGSYLVFKLKVDKGYAQAKAKAEAEAKEEAERRARAEEAARIVAEKKAAEEAAAQAKAEEAARVAAEKKAAQEAAAQAKAEEAARIAAEKAAREAEEARLAAERKAAQEASRAEAAARIAAEKAAREAEESRLAAEKKAAQEAAAQARSEESSRLAEEKRAARETASIAKAEKVAERKAAIDAYNAKYKNKGLVHTLELSYVLYTGDPSEGYDVLYENYDRLKYRSLHPVELKYTFGYRFNNWFSLGLGAGVHYQLVNLYTYGDKFAPIYRGTEKYYTPINIPVFLNTRLYMSRGKFQPMLSLSGGVYVPLLLTPGVTAKLLQENSFRHMIYPLLDVGAGLNVRLGKSSNMYFLVSVGTTPFGSFIEEEPEGYYDGVTNIYLHPQSGRIDPSFKVGFTF